MLKARPFRTAVLSLLAASSGAVVVHGCSGGVTLAGEGEGEGSAVAEGEGEGTAVAEGEGEGTAVAEGEGEGEGTPTPIDPTSADELLFQQGLDLYNAVPPDYVGAQAKFDQLVSTFPASARHDNAGYLGGRCRYEEAVAATVPATAQGLYTDAISKLVAMRQAHPASPFIGAAAYFTGRSRFSLTTPDYTGAISDFQASLAADAAGLFADNATYFLGRSQYEVAFAAAAPANAALYVQAQTTLTSFETNYSASVFIDNGRYYLGRSYYNNKQYQLSIAPFQRVLLTTGSIYEDNALYFAGRANYILGSAAPVTAANLTAAISEFDQLQLDVPTSNYVDNSLRWEAQAYADLGQCTPARAAFTVLQTNFPTSTETTRAQTYLAGKGC